MMVRDSYKCNFPLFSKIEINGLNCHPIYKFLRLNTKELVKEDGAKVIPWNFAKFFVKDGKVLF